MGEIGGHGEAQEDAVQKLGRKGRLQIKGISIRWSLPGRVPGSTKHFKKREV
jgi:hypothetical protein